MNYRFIINQLGLLLVVLSAVMLAVAMGDVAYWWLGAAAELAAMESLLATAVVGLAAGSGMWWHGGGRRDHLLSRREALLLVAVSWLLGAALGAMPYFLWAYLAADVPPDHVFRNYADCYFEAMSGLTTTGATVLSDIEALPSGLLLWRALTQWLGGLGIVVLFVAVLPSIGVGSKRIFHAEVSGPTQAGVRPRIRDTARVLWLIYLGFTLTLILALRLCGMGWFDSVCHTFTTVATGGFSPQNASLGAYRSTAINIVVILFMVLGGVNFGLYYRVIRGSIWDVLRDTELRFYLVLLAGSAAVIAVSLMVAGDPIVMTDGDAVPATAGRAVEQGVFTAVSIQTTTGYATSDFNLWPFTAQAALIVLMFIGGCAGSTSGGIKVIRVWAAMKILFGQVERAFSPNVVRPMRLGSGVIDDNMKLAVLAYVFGIVLLFAMGSVAIMLLERGAADYTTAATASLASICTIGPGLGMVGAVENFGWMTTPSKCVLIILMALGRLEVFTILVLFVPDFWRNE